MEALLRMLAHRTTPVRPAPARAVRYVSPRWVGLRVVAARTARRFRTSAMAYRAARASRVVRARLASVDGRRHALFRTTGFIAITAFDESRAEGYQRSSGGAHRIVSENASTKAPGQSGAG